MDEKPITVWISKKIYKQIKELSKKTGRTCKSIYQESLAKYLGFHKKKKENTK
jgi:predicted DNA-binding protein